jgi:endoglucanase
MDQSHRKFLDELLETPSPSGFERAGQRVWINYVSSFADTVRTDDYGNAVATVEGDGPTVAMAGHSDEIGFIVRDITEDGYLKLSPIGGSDKSVSRGQHVTVQTGDGPVGGVIGQTAIHLRDGEDEPTDITNQYVDIGAEDREDAAERVERGDPITVAQRVADLTGDRIAARGLDNRIGTWAAAEGLRRAAERGTEATVCAVSTVQEEVGGKGAQMVGFGLDPDAVVAVDVTHATDGPETPSERTTGVELGGGPAVSRGGSNHTRLVETLRTVADDGDVPVQLQATGTRTFTDADSFFTARNGIPSLYLGVPNRYMHTPVELIDLTDLDATADLLGLWGSRAHEFEYTVDIDGT